MIGNILANKEVALQRLEICKACDNLVTPVNICKICGCFILAKIALAGSYCPQQRWMPVEKDMSENNANKDIG